MEPDAFPKIGDKLITEITAPEILEMIRVVEERGALDISRRLKQSVSQVFRLAIASGWATIDPTVHLTGALKPRPRVRHMPKVPPKEFPARFAPSSNMTARPTGAAARSPATRSCSRGRQTMHGFRGLASTWANKAERYKSDWIEMAPAHDDENEVRGAYNSALYLSARRRMLQDWADEIDRIAAGDRQGEKLGGRPATPSLVSLPAPTGVRMGRLPDRALRKPYWQRESGAVGFKAR